MGPLSRTCMAGFSGFFLGSVLIDDKIDRREWMLIALGFTLGLGVGRCLIEFMESDNNDNTSSSNNDDNDNTSSNNYEDDQPNLNPFSST